MRFDLSSRTTLGLSLEVMRMSSNGGIAPSFEVRLAPVQRRVGRAQNGSGACAAADHAEAAKFTGQSEGSELGGHSSSCSPFGACAASLWRFLIHLL